MTINWDDVDTIWEFDSDFMPECPLCFHRTHFEQHPEQPNFQFHSCHNCDNQFFVEIYEND